LFTGFRAPCWPPNAATACSW